MVANKVVDILTQRVKMPTAKEECVVSERKTRFATITVTEGTREAVRRMRYRLATEERVPTLAETVEMVFERYTKILDESKETSNACDQN